MTDGRTTTGDALRRPRGRLGLRWLRHGAAAHREGLPGRRARGGSSLHRRGVRRRPRGGLRKFLWAPRLGLYGIQRIHLLPDAVVLCGAGVGGGSLVYANTLYVPPTEFFEDPQWSGITDWERELAPFYDQATRMLGVTTVPHRTPLDDVFAEVAQDMGVGHTFPLTPVGVFFGEEPGKTVPDPFFGGVGPARSGCQECGSCMTGCRHNAKNTLPKNYLGLAEAAGAVVHPLTTVPIVRPRARADTPWRPCAPDRRCVVGARSPPTTWWSPRAPTTRSGCCTGCATTASSRGSPRASVTTAHQLRVDRRRRVDPQGHRLHPGRRDHVVVLPRRAHPHRAGALRQGQQPHGTARHRADRRCRGGAALEGVGRRSPPTRGSPRAPCPYADGPSAARSPW